MTYKIPCGAVMGHGEYCDRIRLCGACSEIMSLREHRARLLAAMVKLSGFSYSTDEKIAIAKKELGL